MHTHIHIGCSSRPRGRRTGFAVHRSWKDGSVSIWTWSPLSFAPPSGEASDNRAGGTHPYWFILSATGSAKRVSPKSKRMDSGQEYAAVRNAGFGEAVGEMGWPSRGPGRGARRAGDGVKHLHSSWWPSVSRRLFPEPREEEREGGRGVLGGGQRRRVAVLGVLLLGSLIMRLWERPNKEEGEDKSRVGVVVARRTKPRIHQCLRAWRSSIREPEKGARQYGSVTGTGSGAGEH